MAISIWVGNSARLARRPAQRAGLRYPQRREVEEPQYVLGVAALFVLLMDASEKLWRWLGWG